MGWSSKHDTDLLGNSDKAPAVEAEPSPSLVADPREAHRLAVEFALNGVMVLDRDSRLVDVNPAACHILGYLKEELLNTAPYGLDPACFREPGTALWDASARKGQEYTEYELLRRDGTPIVVNYSTTPLPNGGYVQIFQEVTEQKRLERYLTRYIRQIEGLQELSTRLLSTQDEQSVLNAAVETAAQTLDVHCCGVFLMDENGDSFRLAAGWGWDAGDVGHLWLEISPDSLAGYARIAREPLIVEDLATGSRFSKPSQLLQRGVVSSVCVPLMTSEEVIGLLACHHRSRRLFSNEEARFLTLVGNHLILALKRARELREHECGDTCEDSNYLKRAAAERDDCLMALDDSQRRLQELIASLRAIVWEADAATLQFTYVSPQAEEMLGYPVRRWLDEPDFWINHIHSQDREQAVAYCRNAIEEGRSHECEYRMLKANEEVVWLRDIVTVQVDNGRPCRLRGVLIDITERKRIEEKQRRLEGQLQQAQKMEMVGTLAGGIAHDFNNILTAVLGYADIGLSQLKPEEHLYHYFEEIRDGAVRAAELTRRMLTFSRRHQLEPKLVDLNSTVTDLSKMLTRLIGEGIDLKIDLEPGLPTVLADASQMEQVLMNLCLNARDAMPDNGRLIISTRAVDLDSEFCKGYPWVNPGNYVSLAVSDTGAGIEDAVQARIFEPFFTTKDEGKGTGLGLAVVYEIIQRHMGLIQVRSEIGRGTTFSIYLAAQEGEPESNCHVVQSVLSVGTETILLAEDQDSLRALTASFLEDMGYTVLLARDGKEAVDQFEAHRDIISLALMDRRMPRCDGLTAAKKMCAMKPELRVLLVSGWSSDQADPDAEISVEYPLLFKPYDMSTLGMRLREILDGF